MSKDSIAADTTMNGESLDMIEQCKQELKEKGRVVELVDTRGKVAKDEETYKPFEVVVDAKEVVVGHWEEMLL